MYGTKEKKKLKAWALRELKETNKKHKQPSKPHKNLE